MFGDPRCASDLASGVFRLSEKDLLEDRRITRISSIKRGGIEKIIRHAFRRICKPETT
ncbi:hypothetical protein [Paludisphaera mucosa]|uniref:Uncharacterized protein n=1 Tax=Paludisphaera mucosa TaxID=3030827 RepID=A0ABT6F9Z5_9BACT|nr:hypothetical protein [Paludisphaera mucosa]MDG3004370.1 hypothetical protein [Paludisphaera mucosa]